MGECGRDKVSAALANGAPLLELSAPKVPKRAPSRFSAECLGTSFTALPALTSLVMAVPGSRMRLTVVVESLAEENAHGEYRELALEAFKERKFAMPVQLEDTFETVWNEIEQRYKTNYLDAHQAAAFSIKKLQDAYDCDLDMTDTVGDIFEGEPDRKMHMIKVVPHFIYRETSVVPGSKLRPTRAQKRVGDDIDEGANKRQRVELQQRSDVQEARDSSPNRPIASTESQHAAAEGAEPAKTDEYAARSRSGISLVELDRVETGQMPFSSAGMKQESPDPKQLLGLNGIDTASPEESAERPVDAAPEEPSQNPKHARPRSSPSHKQSLQALQQPADNQVNTEAGGAEEVLPRDAPTPNGDTEARSGHPASLQLISREDAIQKSPVSSVETEPESAPTPTAGKRKDVYQVPSSPEFMHQRAIPEKHAKKYGRSPRPAQVIRKEVDLLNMARSLSRNANEKKISQEGPPVSISNKARVFQRPRHDEIESTPQGEDISGLQVGGHVTSDDENEGADLTASFLKETAEDGLDSFQTPARKPPVRPVRSDSLKKPSVASLPAITKHGAKSKAAATPSSGVQANDPSVKGTTVATTPSTGGSSKNGKALSHETTSRMEHLQKLLSASQSTPKRGADTSSPLRSDSIETRSQNNKPSAEVRKPEQIKAGLADLNRTAIDAQPALQPATMNKTPMKSPVPLPSSIRKLTTVSLVPPTSAAETPKMDAFKKPAARVRESPVPLPSIRKSSRAIGSGTPRRSEIPFPPNVRDLRRSSSLQSSPLANGDGEKDKSSPTAPATTGKPRRAISSAIETSTEPSVVKLDVAAESTPTAKPAHVADAIVISSAEPSFSDDSDSEKERRRGSRTHKMDKTVQRVGTSTATDEFTGEAKSPFTNTNADIDIAEEEGTGQLKKTCTPNDTSSAQPNLPLTQEKPPSGQGSTQAATWNVQPWGFGSLNKTKDTSDKPRKASEPESRTAVPVASDSDDEGFAEPETYNTAVEDNLSGSRSPSAAASIRSSPAVSRRPARFLSHSPTPVASESEDESDEVSVAHSRATSPHMNDKEESHSDSESSSDSSEDEDVEMPDLHAETTTDMNANAAPPSSPSSRTIRNSAHVVSQTSQPTPPQVSRPTQRTPIPLPTQEPSQAPRSSQSVSVQAVDRRRYTGFRSLREQLADTKAAQATAQSNTFDPRTMSLGKLAKGKPLINFGDDDESSEDESSSSSSSDSD